MTHPYALEAYARGLAHAGDVFATPEWGGHVLVRPTPDGARRDAAGPYPITVLSPDADLAAGLARLRAAGLMSVVLVLDDQLRPPTPALEAAFELFRPFKSHYVHDRSLGPPAYDKHHRYEIRRALTRVTVAEFDLGERLDAWAALYSELVVRRGLMGLHAFPALHHETLAQLPGVRAFGAFLDDRLVSAHIFVTGAGHAMSHLAASSADGYGAGAAYAVNDLALAELSDCQVVNFGGPAGMADDPSDGLARFKKGFANRIVPSWLCGAVLDAEAYAALSPGARQDGFFPAYRAPKAERS